MKACPNCGLLYPDDANFCPVDAGRLSTGTSGITPAVAAPSGAPGMLGGRFQVGTIVGGGRTGAVYEAADTSTGLPCVVKRVASSVFPTPLLKQRTERELRQLERVRAATVAHVLAHGKEGEEMWVALEKVAGRPLSEIVIEQGPMSGDRAKKIVLAIGDALSEAAKVGVIHRDVSPKNVLLMSGDAVKVINFGVPVPVSPKLQGEPEYVSPEQIEGKPVDQRSNIYSLGAVFYYLVTGAPPFAGANVDGIVAQHLSGHITPPSQLAQVSPAVESVILKALERQSSKRFMTLRQMLGDVERAETAGGAPPPRVAPQLAERDAMGKGAARRSAAVTMIGGFTAIEAGIPTAPPPPAAPAQPTLMAAAPGFAPPVPQQQPAMPPPQPAMPPPPPAMPPPQQPTLMPVAAPMAMPQPQPPMQYMSPAVATAPGVPPPPHQQQPTLIVGGGPAPMQATPGPQPYYAPQHFPAPEHPFAPEQPYAAAVQPLPPQQPPQPPQPAVMPADAGAAPAGKRTRAQDAQSSRAAKSKFRETMWFKKGELDAVAAEDAAQRAQTGDDGAPDKVNSLPVEDRYKDDGTITRADQERLSLRTGNTQMMDALRMPANASPSQQMAEEDLVSEMKGGRGLAVAVVIAAVVVLGGLVAFFAFR